MNTADYIIKKLEELGICDFFGVPGDYNFNLIAAIENNLHTGWIGCVNELNAGYAADGYARIKGFGAVVTTYGVGELSAVNAIAGSMAENVPVIHLVGIPETKYIEKRVNLHHNLQDVNYGAFADVYKNVTAASAFLTADNAKLEIDRVLKIFVRERKPVYIAIPQDIAAAEISERYVSYDWTSDEDVLKLVSEKIADKINSSSSPVILGDVLIKRYDSEIEYKEFVEKTGFPVTNFLMGMNIIDQNYPMYIGNYYSDCRNLIAQKAIAETDCLIAVGAVHTDLNSFGFNLPYRINDNIAIYGTYTYVNGKRFDNVKMSDVLNETAKLVEHKDIEINKPNIGYKTRSAENVPINSEYLYMRIQEFIKDNDIIFAETGMVPYGISTSKIPSNADINMQLQWCSIGWATPAAFGASIAKPQARIILISGEGAHQMSAMEIGNMLRFDKKPIVILINNKGYTIERFLSNDFNAEYNNIVQLNYAKFARAFEGDVWATKVNTEDDLDKALKVTQIMNKMCYIEVVTDKNDTPKLIKDYISKSKTEESSISSECIFEEKFDTSAAKDLINKLQISEPAEKEYTYDSNFVSADNKIVSGNTSDISAYTPETENGENKNIQEHNSEENNTDVSHLNLTNSGDMLFETVVHKNLTEKE